MYYNNETFIFKDGEFIKVNDAKTSIYGQTLHYGNGVFEGIRSYDTSQGTKIFKPKEHFDRLKFSAESTHLRLDYSSEDLEKITYKILEQNRLTDAYIRPLVYSGESMSLFPSEESHIVIMAWNWGKFLGDQMIRLKLSSFQRPNPKSCIVEAKVCGHYVNSMLATTEAKKAGYDEALLTDMHGFVAEGPGANLFYEKDGKLYTPSLGNILRGITRNTIIDIAKGMGYEVVEKQTTPEELKTADSAFYCGTAVEVVGIKSLDDYEFPLPWENSIGSIMREEYSKMVTQ